MARKKKEESAKEEKNEDVEETKEESSKKETKEKSSKEKKEKLSALLEKAKKLEESVKEVEQLDLKKKLTEEEEEKKDTLVPIEDYLKSSIHLGTRVITPDMRPYVYKRRADGLAVFNTSLLDEKIKEAINFLIKFKPHEVIVVCKREAGWKPVNKFSELTGITAYTKKYPAGILTNTSLENFREAELLFICDPWLDKNALDDAKRIGIPIMAICDTNNYTQGITKVIPGNNKSAKSIGMIFYLLSKAYIEAHKIPVKSQPIIQEFIEGWENLIPPK